MAELNQIKHYDKLYAAGYAFDRYNEIYETAARLCKGRVLDCGCGLGQMNHYLKNYAGFDGSNVAIKKSLSEKTFVCNLYNPKCYKNADTYLFLEVLEHVDDIRVLNLVPPGKTIVFSVPSFKCYEHVRTYTLAGLDFLPVEIKKHYRFNWHKGWTKRKPDTEDYILLCKGVKL